MGGLQKENTEAGVWLLVQTEGGECTEVEPIPGWYILLAAYISV